MLFQHVQNLRKVGSNLRQFIILTIFQEIIHKGTELSEIAATLILLCAGSKRGTIARQIICMNIRIWAIQKKRKNQRASSSTLYFLEGLKIVLQHSYGVGVFILLWTTVCLIIEQIRYLKYLMSKIYGKLRDLTNITITKFSVKNLLMDFKAQFVYTSCIN